MIKFTYLFLMIFTLLGPMIMSFEKQIHFKKYWKITIKSILIPAIVFIIWDYIYTNWGVWSFNDVYITGFKILNLPIEEISFFFIVPFACIFIYETVHFVFKLNLSTKQNKLIHEFLAFALMLVGIYFYDRLYTSVTFIFTSLSIYYLNVSKYQNTLHKFTFAYLFCLIPFLIVNGILTFLPVVIYNNFENLQIRIISIPVEDVFYGYLLVVWSVIQYEEYKKQLNLKDY